MNNTALYQSEILSSCDLKKVLRAIESGYREAESISNLMDLPLNAANVLGQLRYHSVLKKIYELRGSLSDFSIQIDPKENWESVLICTKNFDIEVVHGQDTSSTPADTHHRKKRAIENHEGSLPGFATPSRPLLTIMHGGAKFEFARLVHFAYRKGKFCATYRHKENLINNLPGSAKGMGSKKSIPVEKVAAFPIEPIPSGQNAPHTAADNRSQKRKRDNTEAAG